MAISIDRMNCRKPVPIRAQKLAERFKGDCAPGKQHFGLEVLSVRRPTTVTIANPPNHPGPHNLDEIEVRRVRRPRRQAIKLTCLLSHLRRAVLFAPVIHSLLANQITDIILLGLSHLVPDNSHIVTAVTGEDRLVVMGDALSSTSSLMPKRVSVG